MRRVNSLRDIIRCPLIKIVAKTQIILSNMKSYEDDKKVCLHEVPNFRVQCTFLDIRLHSLCMLQGGGGGGGQRIFFSAARFFISPPRSIQIFRTPKAISRKNEYPPLPPHKKYQNKYLYINSKRHVLKSKGCCSCTGG